MVPYSTITKPKWPGLPVASQLLPGVLLPEVAYASDHYNDLVGPLQSGSPAPWVLSNVGVAADAAEPLWDVSSLADLPQQLNLLQCSSAGGTAASLDFYPDLIDTPQILHPGPGFVLVQQQQVDAPIAGGAGMLATPQLQVVNLSGAGPTPVLAMHQVQLPLSNIMASRGEQQMHIMQHSQALPMTPHAAPPAQAAAPVGIPALYQQLSPPMGLPPVPARDPSGLGSRAQQQRRQQQQQQMAAWQPPTAGASAMAPPAAAASDDSFWTRAAASAARLQAEGGRRPGGRRSHGGPILTYVTPAPASGPGPRGCVAGSTITAQPGSFSEQMSELLGSLKEGSSQGGTAIHQPPASSPPSWSTGPQQQQQQQQQQWKAWPATPLAAMPPPVVKAQQLHVTGFAGGSTARAPGPSDQRPGGPARLYSANGSSSSSSSSMSSITMALRASDAGSQQLGGFSTGQHLLLQQGMPTTDARGTFVRAGSLPAAGGHALPGPHDMQLLVASPPPSAATPPWVLQQGGAGGVTGLPSLSGAPGYALGATWQHQAPPTAPW